MKSVRLFSKCAVLFFLAVLFLPCQMFAGQGKVSVGIVGSSFSYAELEQKQILDKDNGALFGINLNGEYQENRIWERGIVSWQGGSNIVYRGRYQDGTPVVGHRAHHYVWNLEGNIGYVFKDGQFTLIPYTGVGYRYWHRGMDKLDIPGGYLEKYSWGYIPVGLKVDYKYGSWTFCADGALTLPFGMHMKAELGEIGLKDTTYDLGWRPGFKVSVPVSYDLQKLTGMPVEANVTPYYEYWAIRSSSIVNDSYEPDSATNQVGVIVGVSYRF